LFVSIFVFATIRLSHLQTMLEALCIYRQNSEFYGPGYIQGYINWTTVGGVWRGAAGEPGVG